MKMRTGLVLAAVLGLAWAGAGYARVTAHPLGLGLYSDGGDVQGTVTLVNDGDEDVAFRVTGRQVRREGGRLRWGPRRDEPGETLMEIQLEYDDVLGLSWDPDNRIMFAHHSTQNRIAGYEWDGQEITGRPVDFATGFALGVGVCYYEGVIYAGNWQTPTVYTFDLEGNRGQDIATNMQGGVMDITVDPETEYLYVISFPPSPPEIGVFDINNDYERVATIADLDLGDNNEADFRGRIHWAPEHDEGHLWVSYRSNPAAANSEAWQVNVIPQAEGNWQWEEIQHFEVETNVRSFGIAHDGENLWVSTYNAADDDRTCRIVDDGIVELWSIEPRRGVVEAQSELDITLSAQVEGLEDGVYEMLLRIRAENQEEIQMTVLLTLNQPVASVTGTVTDPAQDDAPVAGATVTLDRYRFIRWTDEEGRYAISNLPLEQYALTASAPDYLPRTAHFMPDQGGDYEVNFPLLHSTCELGTDSIVTSLEPDMEGQTEFTASNRGNGPLTYRIQRSLAGDRPDPWELRETVEVEEITGNTRVNAAALVGDYYYVAAGGGRDTSRVFILTRAGEAVGQFPQFVMSVNGMRDLAWDGHLLWGADGDQVFGFTTDGELEVNFQFNETPIYGVAWDPNEELLWLCRGTGRIYAVRPNGEVDRSFPRPAGLTTSGLDYYPDDPDGYNLYIFCRAETAQDTTELALAKMNTADGSVRFVRDLQVEGTDRPAGLFITPEYDPYAWVAMGVVTQSGGDIPNRLKIWQLDDRRNWMAVEPAAGVIAAGRSQDFTLFLNTYGMPELTIRGLLTFTHDGVGGRTVLPVTLVVAQGRVHTFRTINLSPGWNMVSASLQPDETDIAVLTQDLVDEGVLLMVKDGYGNFYWPAREFNNIEGWDVQQGYLMKATRTASLVLEGESVLLDDPIQLEEGWQIAAYYPRMAVEASVALSSITEHLVIAKDGMGNFYVPEWNFSNMGQLRAGQGYQLRVDADVELVWRLAGGRAPEGWRQASPYAHSQVDPPVPTGSNLSLLALAEPGLTGELAVTAGGRRVGAGWLENGAAGVAVWGDDPTTPEPDGARDGEALAVRLTQDGVDVPLRVEVVRGELVYRTDELTVVRLATDVRPPDRFSLDAVKPNPFNAFAQVTYTLPEEALVTVRVYDTGGRMAAQLFRGTASAGTHTLTFNGAGLPSGLYVFTLESAGRTARMKAALVK